MTTLRFEQYFNNKNDIEDEPIHSMSCICEHLFDYLGFMHVILFPEKGDIASVPY